ncbi:MAG TPA: 2-oxoglutarate dehydrogenase E1 component [Alphaproteobacteria bacterium]|nr:2-oxoglutarate dehydrogenase E1 component [Alphaproteobacteria bacterium]
MSSESVLKQNTFEYGGNTAYIADLYEKYLQNPDSVDGDWKVYFAGLSDNLAQVSVDFKYKNGSAKARSQVVGYFPKPYVVDRRNPKNKGRRAADKLPQGGNVSSEVVDSINAQLLIRAYRVRGHLIADLDPLHIAGNKTHPQLDISRYGFTENDMDKLIGVGGWLGHEKLTLREILNILRATYSSKCTVEIAHIQDSTKKEWLEKRLETSLGRPTLTAEQKKRILNILVETVGFEEFLHKKFPGTKRFSAEGGDNLMVALDFGVARAASLGVKEVVVGMPHRGRLNVLTGFMGKPYVAMLNEFQGGMSMPANINSSGDVKYHLGFSSDKKFENNSVHLSLTPNPSHLEAVNPVVAGRVRAKQDQFQDKERTQVMGILLHGDAAFCGQGIVAESLAMSDLDAYTTGGIFHVVVNNQVGFTTNPINGHKSPYPTDFAMMMQLPIFHVNGDDPEAVVHAAQIAAEYRAKFKQDVVLDMWCYRKHGHNEGDEPRWTQPKMYKVIDAKQTPREIYGEQLIREGVIIEADFEKLKEDFYNRLDTALNASKEYKPEKADMLEGKWTGLVQNFGDDNKLETGVDEKTLKEIAMKLSETPSDMVLHKGITKVLENRRIMAETGQNLDWAMGEALAFGSLLLDGKPVRLTGQDAIRGTFSHRHSGFFDQNTEECRFLLNQIRPGKQAMYEVHNSNLSEFGVLGFEYGYSLTEPNALTIWEAQFGDFVNGAQIMIDQFICSAEIKWLRMSGLVMLLPHGYEGQGPEHSSARLERFLQLCAEDNMIVCNLTTPANYFHALRRQLKRAYRKPLIIMSPKSLLRHKLAVSNFTDFNDKSTFKRVLPETDKLVANDKVRKVLVVSGKLYYELLEERRNKKIDDIAIIRLEQIYPFPEKSLAEEFEKYKNAEVVWVQEEPANAGAWTFVDRKIEKTLSEIKVNSKRPVYIGRPEAAATACGFMKLHKIQQDKIIAEALG